MMSNASGSGIGLTKDTLWQRFAEKGPLKRTDEKRTTIIKRIKGSGKRVVCLDASVISGAPEEKAAQNDTNDFFCELIIALTPATALSP